MFVCLEVDTEDVLTWIAVDKFLVETFGLTHITWGINANNQPHAIKLPATLYYTDASVTESALSQMIQDTFRREFTIGYNIIVIGKAWAHSEHKITEVSSVS